MIKAVRVTSLLDLQPQRAIVALAQIQGYEVLLIHRRNYVANHKDGPWNKGKFSSIAKL